MSESLEFDEKWQALLQRFVARLEKRMQMISDAWDAMHNGADAHASARSVLFHEVHSLAGSGATFGFEELSVVARRLEPLVDPEKVAVDRAYDTHELAQIEGLLDELRAHVQRIHAAT